MIHKYCIPAGGVPLVYNVDLASDAMRTELHASTTQLHVGGAQPVASTDTELLIPSQRCSRPPSYSESPPAYDEITRY